MAKSKIRSGTVLRLLAVCGITGPVLYAIVVAALGSLRPGYDHARQLMSELGETGAPYAGVMNVAGFMMLGLSMIALAYGLHHGVSGGRGSKFGPALIAVAGVDMVAVGFFPCDPGCMNVSFTGFMHEVTATISPLAMILGIIVISWRMKSNGQWRRYWMYSLGTGILTLILSPLPLLGDLEQWSGALQRAGMGLALLWMLVMSVQLLRLSGIGKTGYRQLATADD